MELHDYLAVARKRWVTIASGAALGAAVAAAATFFTVPVYTATTQVYVSVQNSSTNADLLQGSNFTRQQVASYARLVTTPIVLGPVMDDLALVGRADDLAARTRADAPPSSSLVAISVSDTSPALAAAIANAVGAEFTRVVADLERPTDGSASSVKLTVVRPAAVPEAASSPNLRLNLLLGVVLGFGAAAGIALLRDVLDTRVRDERGVSAVTDDAVIGVIPYDDGASGMPLIVQSDPRSQRAEAFRRLRTNLQFLNVDERANSMIVTSSLPGEGKSTTAINLAIAMADAGARVLLIDADLRRPSVATYLGIERNVGLTTVLVGRATREEVTQMWGTSTLHVMPSGQIPPNPSELLGSLAMSALLEEASREYDLVLVDTPPLLPVTDAAVLARCVGGVVVVVGAGNVHRNQLAQSLGALRTVDADILGVVVNREPRQARDVYRYYDYGTDSPRGQARREADRKTSRMLRNDHVDVATREPEPVGAVAPRVWPGEHTPEAADEGVGERGPQHQRRPR